MLDNHSRIYVAGHMGMVGSAIVRRLRLEGHTRILTRTRSELDLTNQSAVFRFFTEEHPTHVFVAAARAGGILANATYPATFAYENLAIECNVIEAARRSGVRRLLFPASSCVYPKHADQPLREEYLLSGPLEPTNAPYAIAKIAGITLCETYARQYGLEYFSVMPTNLYGPGDNFDPEASHVVPALLQKFHDAASTNAESVSVWGTGDALREFLYVDDLADACVFLMNNYRSTDLINIGCGADLSIRDLAQEIADLTGFRGEITFDSSRPDGTPRKLLDVSKLTRLGWSARIPLKEGLRLTYDWFTQHAEASSVRGLPGRR